MNYDSIILDFMAFLADTRAEFRKVHLIAEQEPAVRSVSISVIPFRTAPSEYAENGTTLSVALNAELLKPTDSSKQALGMSLLLRRTRSAWCIEAEVGWTGTEIGWDPFFSIEEEVNAFEAVKAKTPYLTRAIGERFIQEMSTLSA